MTETIRKTQRCRARKSATAFTLIELLVVIAIIALLIGILPPALGNTPRASPVRSTLDGSYIAVNSTNDNTRGIQIDLAPTDVPIAWFVEQAGAPSSMMSPMSPATARTRFRAWRSMAPPTSATTRLSSSRTPTPTPPTPTGTPSSTTP